MDRRIVTAVVAVGTLVVGCSPGATLTGSSQPSDGTPTVQASAPAPSATAGLGWTPGAIVTLGAASSVPLGDFVATRLTATPAGFALIGQDGNMAPLFVAGSPDATSWSRLDAAALGSDFNDLAAGARGAVLAARDSSGETGHLWFSPDGRTWGRIDQPAGLDHVAVQALFAGAAGFALAGDDATTGDAVPTVWTSADGHDWHEATALRGIGISQLLVLDNGFVAVNPPDAPQAISVSVDGTAWRTIPGSSVGPITGNQLLLAAVGSEVVVILGGAAQGGIEAWAGAVDPARGSIAWRQASEAGFAGADVTALGTAASAGALLGFDRASLAPATWTTADGSTWTRHDLSGDALGGGASALLATSGTTAVNLGWTGDATGRTIRQLWRSDDGAAWSPVPSDLFGTLAPLSRNQCPATPPSNATELLAITPALRSFCYEGQALTVTGYVVDCGGCGGTGPLAASPSWLIDALGFSRFWLSPSPDGNISSGVGVDVDPAHPINLPAFGRKVRLTGHFADPASATCRLIPASGSGAELPPPGQAILQCREEFVATGVTLLPG
jgi:hypothetical protein